MNAVVALVVVLALMAIGALGAAGSGLGALFGIVIPYAAVILFVVGFIWRVVKWGKAPVPFRIPTTCGQQKSLDWVKQDKLDNPYTTGQVIWRMVLEVFLFRSLFRNTRADINKEGKLGYGSEKLLWLAGILFHYSMLVIVLRHLRLFLDPVPGFVNAIALVDGMFEIAVPVLYLSGLIFLAALGWLFVRRVIYPQFRYISLLQDYFPLFLLLAIGITGVLMRYFFKVDIEAVKELTLGLATFSPAVPANVGWLFYAHLFLVSVLFAYFPFSKLMHMGGVFLSPTRNLANNNRAKHHENPWNYPVKTHPYEEYEEEFRKRMVQAGIPVEKPLEEEPAQKEE